MKNTPEIRAHRQPWNRAIAMLITTETHRVDEIKMVPITGGEMPRPSLEISHEDAQTLMDDLWHCGLRPTEGAGSAGALAAVKYHLEDMRKLVFEKQKP